MITHCSALQKFVGHERTDVIVDREISTARLVKIVMEKQLVIHGHFYQPPRENPWTGVIDPELSAYPFANWNERIHAECYEPNTAVRVVDSSGEEHRVNNYEHISFDFGPTLLTWLKRYRPETYSRILAADRVSVNSHRRHGNAIAHGYNHAILPLCNEHDRRTQIVWGLADFRYRFGREPESLWLPETACDDNVLGSLIDVGMKFVILAPQQVSRIRTDPTEAWQQVSAEMLDTSVSYKYFHHDGSGRSIAVFFYDPVLARGIAFEDLLASSHVLAEAFASRSRRVGPLINVATDGESYGHHHKFGDLCLAYAVELDAPARGFNIRNYGEHLEEFPPQLEVQISEGETGEGSSWSCVHGVSRWIRDCGCHTGGETGWNQAWRGPLRAALDYLRDAAAGSFEMTRGELFVDPWAARDDAIELVLDESASRERFVRAHAPRALSRDQELRALLFLEVQRNALLMYTSCGWFFSELAALEPVQILKYACRAIELIDDLKLPSPRARFLEILAEAKSNRKNLGNGADIYRRIVEPLRDGVLTNEVLAT